MIGIKEITILEVDTLFNVFDGIMQVCVVKDKNGEESNIRRKVDPTHPIPFFIEGDVVKVLYDDDEIIAIRR